MGDLMNYLLGFLIILVLIFAFFREVICWYWKINASLGELRAIRESLESIDGHLKRAVLNSSSSAAAPAASNAVVPNPVSPQCPKCGTASRPEDLYCEACGASLEEES